MDKPSIQRKILSRMELLDYEILENIVELDTLDEVFEVKKDDLFEWLENKGYAVWITEDGYAHPISNLDWYLEVNNKKQIFSDFTEYLCENF